MALVTPGLFSGTSFAVMDGKGRIAVPAALRTNVMETPVGERRERVLWVSFHDELPCLVAFGQDQYDRLMGEIETQRLDARERRVAFNEDDEFKKRFSWTDHYILDGSGRFSPSATHKRRSGPSGPIAFVGAGKRFEIWSLAKLAECEKADPDLREMAAEILAEGGKR